MLNSISASNNNNNLKIISASSDKILPILDNTNTLNIDINNNNNNSINHKSENISIVNFEFNEDNEKFIINYINNISYSFTIEHIVKYLGSYYDTHNQLLTNINVLEYQEAKNVIKKYLFYLQYNKNIKYTTIHIRDYSESNIMGDIDFLMKLNNILPEYKENKLHYILANVDSKNKFIIEQNFLKFTFMLLNYTIKLISKVSEQSCNELTDKQKIDMVEYSVKLVYQINIFVQEQLKIINDQNNNIKNLIEENMKLKLFLNK